MPGFTDEEVAELMRGMEPETARKNRQKLEASGVTAQIKKAGEEARKLPDWARAEAGLKPIDRTQDTRGHYEAEAVKPLQKMPQAPEGANSGLPVTIEFPYPVSVNRIARAGKSGVFVSKEAKAYKEACGHLARQAYSPSVPFLGHVSLFVTLHPRRTKKGVESGVCVDLSNILKLAEDSLSGIVLRDDKQVRRIEMEFGEPVEGGALVVSVERWKGGIENE